MKALKMISILVPLTMVSVSAMAYGTTPKPITGTTQSATEEPTTTTTTTSVQPSDTGITTDIKTAFIKEKLFGEGDISAMSIQVETNAGVVHLTGTADNQQQIDNAITISKSVNGVKSVVSEVKVSNSTQ